MWVGEVHNRRPLAFKGRNGIGKGYGVEVCGQRGQVDATMADLECFGASAGVEWEGGG